ncbi:MAG: hypothetical protein K2X27_27995 [Candidatus Obscuribacterales bacterium]|nr:hypothetical protein [Candidatus Obscuribacterales bacterium]
MASISNSLKKTRQSLRAIDLLSGAGLLNQAQLEQVAMLVEQTAQPIERILVGFKFVSPELMEAANKLHKMNSESILPAKTAMKALTLIKNSGLSIAEALAALGCCSADAKQESPLGLFLMEANIISLTTYEQALSRSKQELCSFGSYLVMKSLISYKILNAALHAICLVLQGKLSRSKAISVLRYAYDSGASLWDALTADGFNPDVIASCQLSLGELLTQAGLISEMDRTALVEFSISDNVMLGELLLRQGLTENQVLNAALTLQKLAKAGAISSADACQILKAVNFNGADLRTQLECRYIKGDGYLTREAIQLLSEAALVNEHQVAEATMVAHRYSIDVLRGLVMSGALNGQLMETARALALRVRLGGISHQQAVFALLYCDRVRCSTDDGLEAARAEEIPQAEVKVSEKQEAGQFLSKLGNIVQNCFKRKPLVES